MTKAGLFHHNITHILRNKNGLIIVNVSRSLIPKVELKNKRYTTRDVKNSDHVHRVENIIGEQMKQILYIVGNNILQNLPFFWEGVGMAEEIYGPSVPSFLDKTVKKKIKQVEPVMVPSVPKEILSK